MSMPHACRGEQSLKRKYLRNGTIRLALEYNVIRKCLNALTNTAHFDNGRD